MINTPSLRLIIAQQISDARPSIETYIINARNKTLATVLETVESFEKREKTIVANRSLSDEGKRQQLTNMATEALNQFPGLLSSMRHLHDSLGQLRRKMFTIELPKNNEVVAFLRQQEIRGGYLEANANERDTAFLLASERLDDEAMVAFLDAPGGPMVSDETKDRAFEARAKKLFPEDFKVYSQQLMLQEVLEMILNSIAKWIAGLGVPPEKIDLELGTTITPEWMAGRLPINDDPAADSKFVAGRS